MNNHALPGIPQLLASNKPTKATVALVAIPLSIVAFIAFLLTAGLSIRRWRRLRNQHQTRTILTSNYQSSGSNSKMETCDEEKGGVLVPHPLFVPIELGNLPQLPRSTGSSPFSETAVVLMSRPPSTEPEFSAQSSKTIARLCPTSTTRAADPKSSAYNLPPLHVEPIANSIANDNDGDFYDVELEHPSASSNVRETGRKESSTPIDYFQPSAPFYSEVILPRPKAHSVS